MGNQYKQEPIKERIKRRVAQVKGCWIWNGTPTNSGYGMIKANGETRLVHRVSYENFIGPIPKGLVIDHLCKTKMCVNPDHLEVVSSRENTMRADNAPASINAKKTHCKHGHEFTADNTYRSPQFPKERNCRECRKIAVGIYQQKKGELLWVL